MTEKGYFVSDLHLLSSRSQGEEYWEPICEKASGAAAFVLGGDIFDFRWARTATSKEAVQEAIRWLDNLASRCPQCHFHYLLGNHDYLQAFIVRLRELSGKLANLSWHRFHLRLGPSLFLHGDVADGHQDATSLRSARSQWLFDRKRGTLSNGIYDLAVRARLHIPIPYIVKPKKTTAKRILAYLENVGHGPGQGVKDVYFGHTHRPFSDFRYGGLTFHNSGGAIQGLNLQILEAAIGC